MHVEYIGLKASGVTSNSFESSRPGGAAQSPVTQQLTGLRQNSIREQDAPDLGTGASTTFHAVGRVASSSLAESSRHKELHISVAEFVTAGSN